MNKIEEYVRKHVLTSAAVRRGNFFYVCLSVLSRDGTILYGHGFSKFNPNDAQHGMPYDPLKGRIIAQGRAMKDLIAAAMAKAAVG
jgi:hypothetical protein